MSPHVGWHCIIYIPAGCYDNRIIFFSLFVNWGTCAPERTCILNQTFWTQPGLLWGELSAAWDARASLGTTYTVLGVVQQERVHIFEVPKLAVQHLSACLRLSPGIFKYRIWLMTFKFRMVTDKKIINAFLCIWTNLNKSKNNRLGYTAD